MRFQDKLDKIWKYIVRNPKSSYTWNELGPPIGIKTSKNIQPYLRKLILQGKLKRIGRGKSTRYEPIFDLGPVHEWFKRKVNKLLSSEKGDKNPVAVFPSYNTTETTPVSLIFLTGGAKPINLQYPSELQDLARAAFLRSVLTSGKKNSVGERIKENTPEGYWMITMLITQKGMLDYVKNMEEEIKDKAFVNVYMKPQDRRITFFDKDLITDIMNLALELRFDIDKITQHPRYKDTKEYHEKRLKKKLNLTRKDIGEIIHQYWGINFELRKDL